MLSAVPDWLKEPDIRTYLVETHVLDYLIDGTHTTKDGYLLKLYRNDKIRQVHFFTNKRQAEKHGKKYMKEEDSI